MIGGNGSKQPQKGHQARPDLPVFCRLDTSMPPRPITVVSNPGNSELP
jgi:hypothetical protein